MFELFDKHGIPWQFEPDLQVKAELLRIEECLFKLDAAPLGIDSTQWLANLRWKLSTNRDLNFAEQESTRLRRFDRAEFYVDQTCTKKCLETSDILHLHALLLEQKVTTFRTQNTLIKNPEGSVVDEKFPIPSAVPELIDGFIQWCQWANDLPPLMRALAAHVILLSIHPFPDGNGRVSRLVEYWLMQNQNVKITKWLRPELMIHLYYRQYVEKLIESRKAQHLKPFVHFFLICYREFLESQIQRN